MRRVEAVAVLGAGGFVGAEIARRIEAAGATAIAVRAPRLTWAHSQPPRHDAGEFTEPIRRVVEQIRGADAIVNAAGLARPDSGLTAELIGANAVLPRIVSVAAHSLGLRMVHISSAAVQGRARLDESGRVAPFSAYSQAKAWGESWLLDDCGRSVTVLRPTSVHGRDRTTSHALARVARSSLSSVAGRGTRASPQVLVADVSEAVWMLLTADAPPRIALQPWGGLTVRSVLELLGGRTPKSVPEGIARQTCRTMEAAGRRRQGVANLARRLEMLWFGQEQASTWFDRNGWRTAPVNARWQELAAQLAEAPAPQGEGP